MFESILYPAIALIALSFVVAFIHFISSIMNMGEGKEWGNTVPLLPQEESPLWLKLQKNNIKNLFEFPIIFFFLVSVIYSANISSNLIIYSAWIYFLFRLLHSIFHIFFRNGNLRSVPWVFSQATLITMFIGFCIEIV